MVRIPRGGACPGEGVSGGGGRAPIGERRGWASPAYCGRTLRARLFAGNTDRMSPAYCGRTLRARLFAGNMDRMALAYFITFTTYGTWLHGTDKGMGSVDRDHNEFGAPFVTPSGHRVARSQGGMAQPAYVMGPAEREVVCGVIVATCAERGWQLLAAHVRTNHAHVVVAAARDAGRVMADLKARASRALTRAGFGDADRRRWTRHGSTLHLFDAAVVADKVDYTLNRQGAPMAVYDGTAPGGAAHGGTPE
jgi:hypothetical protein